MIARDGVVYASTMTKIYAIQDNGNAPQTLWTVDTFVNRLLLDQDTLFYYTRIDSIVAIGTIDVKTGQKKWNFPLKTQEEIEGVFAAGGNRLYANIRNAVQMTSKMVAFTLTVEVLVISVDALLFFIIYP